MMLARGVPCLVAVLNLVAQDHRDPALQQALGLTDFQLRQIEQQHAVGNSVLDDSQKAKLAEIEKILPRAVEAANLITLGLIDADAWPPSLCFYPIQIHAAQSDLRLTPDQIAQFVQSESEARHPLWAQITAKVWAQITAKAHRQADLLNAGFTRQSPEVVQLGAETAALQNQLATIRPPRAVALAVLTDAQKAQVAAFDTAMHLVRDAIKLRLTTETRDGEILCH